MSNYGYGSAKAGFSTYLSGLRQRLEGTGVSVIDVKPGFVNTPMTKGLDIPSIMLASPDKVAEGIFKAYKRNYEVVYTPFYWRWIMLLIKLMPAFLFRRLKI